MMDLDTIHEMNAEKAAEAASDKRAPAVFHTGDDPKKFANRIPHIGNYVPPGWERVNLSKPPFDKVRCTYMGDADGAGAMFVDSSGLGAPAEPALTIKEFFDALRPDFGYAIVEAGQFQVKIGVFNPEGGR